jgi:hypothetical protein
MRRLSAAIIIVAVTAAPSRAQEKDRPLSPALPGNVVEVKAAEFSFRAPDTIPSGLTTFRLLQTGLVVDRLAAGAQGRDLVADQGDGTRGMHMLWIVRLDSGKTVSDLYKAVVEREPTRPWARQLGGAGFILPPSATNVTLDLEAGSYALVCYVGSAHENRARFHLMNGMFKPLTVVPAPERRSPPPRVDVIATISPQEVVTFGQPLRAGQVAIRVVNESDADLEFKWQRMPDGITAKAFLAQPPGAGPGIPLGGLSSVPGHGSVITTLTLTAGEYVVATHAAIRHATSRPVTVLP